jgi:endo-1,4-beta-xylanase
MKSHSVPLACAIVLAACSTEITPSAIQVSASDEVRLAAAFENKFLVGSAVNVGQLISSNPTIRQKILDQINALPDAATHNWNCVDTAEARAAWENAGQNPRDDSEFRGFILRHFNALTAENAMKWECVQPAEDTWIWEAADEVVNFSAENNMHLTGHTLVWHQQTPDWVFEDADGKPASRELLLDRMRKHINTVVGRYKGKVRSWDVVNEAIEEDGSLRSSNWQRIIGDDFIDKAFEYAHAADPDALLIYNDYNMFKPARRDAVIALVERLRSKGIPIHGIGMQGHFRVDYPESVAIVEDAIVAFAKLDIDIAITELDVSVLPWPGETPGGADISDRHAYNLQMNPYANGLTADGERQFNERYRQLFDIFLDHSDDISRVTLWGIDDSVSWRNNWPMEGRTDYPLLFDRDRQIKPVVRQIVDSMSATQPR